MGDHGNPSRPLDMSDDIRRIVVVYKLRDAISQNMHLARATELQSGDKHKPPVGKARALFNVRLYFGGVKILRMVGNERKSATSSEIHFSQLGERELSIRVSAMDVNSPFEHELLFASLIAFAQCRAVAAEKSHPNLQALASDRPAQNCRGRFPERASKTELASAAVRETCRDIRQAFRATLLPDGGSLPTTNGTGHPDGKT